MAADFTSRILLLTFARRVDDNRYVHGWTALLGAALKLQEVFNSDAGWDAVLSIGQRQHVHRPV